MTRIWTWKQILDSLSFGNCCFCATFYTVRQLEKKRKIENLVDCPKKRKPVRASREKVLTEKIFLTDFFALSNWILSLKMCEKKTKSSFSDKFARFEKLLELWLFEKFRWNLGWTENSAETDRKKLRKTKKRKEFSLNCGSFLRLNNWLKTWFREFALYITKLKRLATSKHLGANTRLCSQAGWCALSGFCARIHFVAVRQRIRPQTARAHSLGRYLQA